MASSDKKKSAKPHGHRGSGKYPSKSPYSPPRSDDDPDIDFGDDEDGFDGMETDDKMEDEKTVEIKPIDLPYLDPCGAYKEASDKLHAEKAKTFALRSHYETLQSRFSKLKIEKSRDFELYKESKASADESLLDANNENDILECTIAELETEIGKMKAYFKKNVPDARFYLDEISAKDAKIESCNQEKLNCFDQINKLQEKVTTLETTNQEQHAAMVAKDEEVSWLRKGYDGVRDESTEEQSKWNSSLRAKEADLAKNSVGISEKHIDNNVLKRKETQIIQAHNKTIEESKARERAKDQQIIQLQAQISGASTVSELVNVDMRKGVEEHKNEMAGYQAKEQAQEREMSELRVNGQKQFKDMIARAEAQIANRSRQNEDLKEKVGAKDQEILTLKNDRAGAADKFHKLDNEHKAVCGQLNWANAAMETKIQEFTKLKAELSKALESESTLKTEADEAIRSHVRQIEEQNNELINVYKHAEVVCSTIAAKDQEIDQLRADRSGTSSDELNALRADAEEEIGLRDRAIADQRKDLATAGATIEELRGKVNVKDREIAQLKAERGSVSLDEYEAWKVQTEATIQARDRTIEELKKESTNQDNAMDGYRGRDQDIITQDKGIAQVGKERDDVSASVQDRDQKIIEQNKEMTGIDDTIDDSRAAVQTKDQQILRLTNDNNALKQAKDQEIAQLVKERDDASEQVSLLKLEIEETVQDCDQKIKEQSQESRETVRNRDQKIKEQKQEIEEMGVTNDGLHVTVQAKEDEISKLHHKLQNADRERKESAITKNQLDNHIVDQEQTIKKRDQTISNLHKTVQDLKDQVKVHEKEKKEISKRLEDNENVGNFANRARLLHELDQERKKCRQAITESAGLENVMVGLHHDVDKLKRSLGERIQTAKDLHDEVKAAIRKNNETQKAAVTKAAKALAMAPAMADAATQVEAGEEKRPDNELRQVPLPLPRVRTFKGEDWYTKPDQEWYSGSENEEPPKRPLTFRRRKSSSPIELVRTNNAATQTDDQPKPSQASSQPAMVVKSKTLEVGTQTDGERKRAAVNRGTQTDPTHPSPVITGAATRPQTSSWRHVPWWLLLLMSAVLLAATLSGISAHHERMMWLAANDHARKAVISVRVGGGTGTKVPAWLWREPLVHLTNRYS
ncbi:MAG: hypothetical protein Q9216_000033 [Gyalolechia sp. 2 TL-2023]